MKDFKRYHRENYPLPCHATRNHLVATDWIYDINTTFQEIGIFICIIEHGYDKPMSTQHIASYSGDGYISTLSALKSLEKKKYIEYHVNSKDLNEFNDEHPNVGSIPKDTWKLTRSAAKAAYVPYIESEVSEDE